MGTMSIAAHKSVSRSHVQACWTVRAFRRMSCVQLRGNTGLAFPAIQFFKHAGRFELSDVCLAFNCEAIRGWPSPRFSFSSTESSRGGGAVGDVAGCFHLTFSVIPLVYVR